MEILSYIIANWDLIMVRTGQHIAIVGVAVGLAILTGVPIGILITQNKQGTGFIVLESDRNTGIHGVANIEPLLNKG